ncbi:MAG: phage terminase large subunit family protein [Betaproteobacteria bacterium]|nr:MAG: phage terminase large subunit family protein [Betaproteobacteria bacterium]
MNSVADWMSGPPALPRLANPTQLWCSAFSEGLALDPERTVSEWADANRVLSKAASAEPGRWSTERTPYLREIMDALSPTDPVQHVVLQKATQLGGTECGNNWIGAIIDQGLGPTMMVQPTSNAAKKASRTRLGPMIRDTPCLREKVREAKSRDSGNTILLKEFDGGVLILAGANSATELKSSPVRNQFLDETEEYPADVDGQGDPEELAEKRTDTFARRKIFKVSTPTISGGRIDVAYKASDQRLYLVPCPQCGHHQALRFEQLRWETRKVLELTDADSGEIREVAAGDAGAEQSVERDTGELLDVWYECAGCRARIDEHAKSDILRDAALGGTAHWVPQNPGPDRAKGYKINALYSPLGWFGWRQVVLKKLAADKDPSGTKLKTFWNTILGEAYDEAGEAIEPHFLKARIEPWRIGGMVPAKCLLLAAGVDVQHNRLEVYVWGFGRDLESWVVDRQVIYGSPALEETWRALEDLLAKGWAHAGGQSLRLTRLAIDSSDGVTTHYVRVFARKWMHTSRVIAVKGQSVAGKALIGKPTKQDVNYRGEILKQGVEIWQYGADTAKGALYARLKIEEPGAGYVHIPSGLPDEFFEQLTAEKRVTRYLRGQPRVEWVLEKGRRNEALDCAGMAHAAAESAGLARVNWDALERLINPGQRDLFAEAAKPAIPTAGADAASAGADAVPAPPAAVVHTSGLAPARRGRRVRGRMTH